MSLSKAILVDGSLAKFQSGLNTSELREHFVHCKRRKQLRSNELRHKRILKGNEQQLRKILSNSIHFTYKV